MIVQFQVSQNFEKVSWLALQKSNYQLKFNFPTMTFCPKKCHGCVITMTFPRSTMTFLKYQIYTFGPSKNLTFWGLHWTIQPYALPIGLYSTAAEHWFFHYTHEYSFHWTLRKFHGRKIRFSLIVWKCHGWPRKCHGYDATMTFFWTKCHGWKIEFSLVIWLL